jgi:hypothetical protein
VQAAAALAAELPEKPEKPAASEEEPEKVSDEE